MCGRFTRHTDSAVFAERFDATLQTDLPLSYNIAPSQAVLVARVNAENVRELVALRWGLVPGWSKGPDNRYSMINARAETVAEKPAYRTAFKQRRCLFAADGFYEWKRDGQRKQPFYIGLRDEQPFAMAGLWEYWQGEDGTAIESCAVITTDANELVADIHDRMPVILDPADYATWLSPGIDEPAARKELLTSLLKPFAPERMRTYPVSTRVNSPKNNDAACMEPL